MAEVNYYDVLNRQHSRERDVLDMRRMGASSASQDEARDALLSQVLLQTYTVASEIIHDLDKADNFLYTGLLKQLLSDLRIYSGGTKDGYEYIKRLAESDGIPFDVIETAALECRDDTAPKEPTSLSETLNPNYIRTLPKAENGSSVDFTPKTTGPDGKLSAEYIFQARYNAETDRFSTQFKGAAYTAIPGRPEPRANTLMGDTTNANKSFARSSFARKARASQPASSRPVLDRSTPPDESTAAPQTGSDRVTYTPEQKTQQYVDQYLVPALRDMRQVEEWKQNNPGKELPAELQKKEEAARKTIVAAAAVKNPVAAASWAVRGNNPKVEEEVANEISKYSDNILASLEGVNSQYAEEFLPTILDSVLDKAKVTDPAKREEYTKAINSQFKRFGIKPQQAMNLLRRMNAQTERMDQQQQEAMQAKFASGDVMGALTENYAESFQEFLKDNPDIQENVLQAASEDEDLAQQLLPYIQDAAVEQLGLDETTGGWFKSMMSGLHDTFKMPASAIVGLLRNGKDAFKEITDLRPKYNNLSPTQDQMMGVYQYSTRLSVTEPIRKAQYEAGLQNIKKMIHGLGIKDEGDQFAKKVADVLNSPIVQQGGAAVKNALLNQLGDQAAAYKPFFDQVEANFSGLVHGFQGDYNDVFNTATRGVYDRRALEQYGLMASRMTQIQPTHENNFKRAENYAAALRGMIADGFRPESAIIRTDTDMARQLMSLTPEQQEDLRAKHIFDQVSKVEGKWAAVGDDEAKQQEALKSIGYNAEDEGFKAFLAKNDTYTTDTNLAKYTAYTAYLASNQANEVFNAGKGSTAEEVQANLRDLQNNPMVDSLKTQLGAQRLQQTLEDRAELEKNFADVRMLITDPTGFAAKLGSTQAEQNQQLIRMFGGTDVTGNRAQQVERAESTMAAAASAGISLERAASMVSESGKQAQALGLGARSTQAVGNIATTLAAMTITDPSLYSPDSPFMDKNKVQAQATRNAANIASSETGRNIMWLMRNEVDSKSPFADIKRKLMEGTPLTADELRAVQNTSLLSEADTQGSAHFALSRSQAVYDEQLDTMTADERKAFIMNATAGEQNILRENMSQSFVRDYWENAVGKGHLDKLGYKEGAAYSAQMDLMGVVGKEEMLDLLSGSKELTKERREKLEDLGVSSKTLDAIEAASKAEVNDEQRKLIREQMRGGLTALAATYGVSPEELIATMNRPNMARYNQIETSKDLAKLMGLNPEQTDMEAFLTATDSTGSAFGRIAKGFLQGFRDRNPNEVREVLGEGRGIASLLAVARMQDDAESMFETLTDKGTNEDQAEWLKAMHLDQYEDEEGNDIRIYNEDGTINEENLAKAKKEAYKKYRGMNPEELLEAGKDIQDNTKVGEKAMQKIEGAAAEEAEKAKEEAAKGPDSKNKEGEQAPKQVEDAAPHEKETNPAPAEQPSGAQQSVAASLPRRGEAISVWVENQVTGLGPAPENPSAPSPFDTQYLA